MRQAIAELALEHLDSTPVPRVSASFGVASMQVEGDCQPGELVELADQRLYEAKHRGRNRVYAG